MKIYLVGGAVRDMLMNLEPKDKDYVVVGTEPQELLDLGFKQVGADFPVFLHPETGEEYFSKVKRGMPVKVKLDVYPNQSFAGKVKLVYPTIDERTRTFPVEIEMNNPGQKIRPGMFARVGINFGKVQRVVVPDRAIVKIPGTGTRYVYTYSDGKVSFSAVELGRRMDAEYELISGVENGAQVVVAGQSKLSDGSEVVIAE